MYNISGIIYKLLNYILPILLIPSFLYLLYSIFKRIKSDIETRRKVNKRILKSIIFIFFLILIWATASIIKLKTHSNTDQPVSYYFKNNPHRTYTEKPEINTKTESTFRLYPNQRAIIEDLNAYLEYTGATSNGGSYTAIYDLKYLNPKNNKDDPEKDGYCVSQKSGRTVHGISDEYFDFIVYKNENGDRFSCDEISYQDTRYIIK